MVDIEQYKKDKAKCDELQKELLKSQKRFDIAVLIVLLILGILAVVYEGSL